MINHDSVKLMNDVLDMLGVRERGMIRSISLQIDVESCPRLTVEQYVCDETSPTQSFRRETQGYTIKLEPTPQPIESSEVKHDNF